MKTRMLVVDDDPSILESLTERFEARGFSITTAMSGRDAIDQARSEPDIILLDLQLPQGDGIAVLKALREEGIESTVIVITAHGSVEKAVQAMREGAYDFLQKPFDPNLAEETIRRALERDHLKRENRALKEARTEPEFIVADSEMNDIVAMVRKASSSNATILVLGESGTGKEVIAQQVHAWSPRTNGPFIAVNCVALPETLLESELFGHEKGAFTGASQRKPGKIELAHGGTLFLDEIGDISAAFQAKLLRVLQERSFERVGGTTPIEVDVRVVAATNKDLKHEVKEGRFREDLFYRLNVISLTLPPLRDRPLDIEKLAVHFTEVLGREAKRPDTSLTEEALGVLRGYSWPGNIRELRNAIERAVVLCEDDVITPLDLPPDIREASTPESTGGGFHEQAESYRKKIIRDALAASDGNQTKAAEQLGLQRTYLARLIKKYDLQSPPG